MNKLLLAALLAACGSSKPAPATPDPSSQPPAKGVVTDSRTPIEKRRDAACDALAPKLTQCAVADAKADFAAGKITQQQLSADTSADVQRKHAEEFGKKCRVPMSSRQVRVLEVCQKEESECAPLADCLGHLSEAAP